MWGTQRFQRFRISFCFEYGLAVKVRALFRTEPCWRGAVISIQWKSWERISTALSSRGVRRAALTWMTLSWFWRGPSTNKKRERVTATWFCSYIWGVTMMLAMPVSSSMERKTKPLAVPGRWRAMTQPAARTHSPSRQGGGPGRRGRSGARSSARR